MLRQASNLPPVLQVILALNAWNELSVLWHSPWLGRSFCVSILREAGITKVAHLAAINLGLKDRRRPQRLRDPASCNRARLIAVAEIGMKGHDRLALARKLMDRKLEGRRTSSKLPELVYSSGGDRLAKFRLSREFALLRVDLRAH